MSEASAEYGHVRMSRREVAFSATTLLALGGFVASLVLHSTDSASAVVQRVAAAETDIRSLKESREDQQRDEQAFRQQLQERLGTIDGRTVDIYRVLLDVQRNQAQAAKP